MTGQSVTMANTVPPIVAFNYDLVAEDYQATLMAAAERIKFRFRQQTADMFAIGHDLLKIKSELEHGLFLDWIKAEFGFSVRTAQRYMRAAEFAGNKCDTVSYLPQALVYALADETTPDEIKTEVRADLEAGKPVDVKAVKGRIKDARWHRRKDQEQKHNRRKPVSETTRKRREREEEQQREEAERREAEQKAHAAEIVAILRKLPEQDFERLLELLTTASLWVVQGMLNRGRA